MQWSAGGRGDRTEATQNSSDTLWQTCEYKRIARPVGSRPKLKRVRSKYKSKPGVSICEKVPKSDLIGMHAMCCGKVVVIRSFEPAILYDNINCACRVGDDVVKGKAKVHSIS